MKNWLSEETVSKINILGSDYLPYLLTLIDEENLPATLGGKCKCDCPGGCESSNAGPWKEDKNDRVARRAKESGTERVDSKVQELDSHVARVSLASMRATDDIIDTTSGQGISTSPSPHIPVLA